MKNDNRKLIVNLPAARGVAGVARRCVAACCGVAMWVAAAAVLWACGNADYYRFAALPDGTEVVNPGRVSITLPGFDPAPAGTRILLYAPGAAVDGAGNRVPLLSLLPGETADLSAGTYSLLALVPPAAGGMDGLTVGSNAAGAVTAVLAPVGAGVRGGDAGVVPGGAGVRGGDADVQLPSAPAVLTATGSIGVEANAVTTGTLSPVGLTRGVALRVATRGIDAAQLAGISARLQGILRRLPEASDATTYFIAPALAPASAEAWSTSFRLLGVASGMGQVLHLSVALKNGSVIALSQDVTSLFAGFNARPPHEVLELEATLTIALDGVEATVSDWKEGWDEGGTGV